MEVLQAVLLLLPPSLVFLVLFVTIIISGQLMAAQGAGICLTEPGQNAVGMEEVMAGHLNDSLLLLKFQKAHRALELSLGATDDRSGEALYHGLGSWWRQVVFPVYQSQVLKVHPIKE